VKRMTRRSLTQVGGRVEVWADGDDLGGLLVAALEVDADESRVMQHVHGFHTYPARMHPDTARELVSGLSGPNDAVLDPFMGSGTVLVEARLHGRRAFGIDANPLAVALAHLKLSGIEPDKRALFLGVVEAVCDHAEMRRCAKAGPSRRYSQQQRDAFEPHVLLELDGLSQGIDQASTPELAPTLRLVLSSLIVKVSRRRSDTSSAETQRRLSSGFVIRFFAKKARELLGRLDDYAHRLPPRCPPAKLELGDARKLPLPNSSISVIITSPPYPGVYDYVEHHRLRMEWLKLDVKHLECHEIGAHRHFAKRRETNAEADWALQLGACLDEMARVLVPGGAAAILIADSAVAGRAWYADRALRELAPRHGFTVTGGASQRRGHFHAPTQSAFDRAVRREHLIVLQRAMLELRAAGIVKNPSERRSQGLPHPGRPPSPKGHVAFERPQGSRKYGK
jgi:DNA modification methylase